MKKFIAFVTLLLTMSIIGIKGAKAEVVSISQNFIDGVWSYHYRNGDYWTFGNLPYNYANGKLVYCIQPDARINIDTYYTYGDFSLAGYSEYEKNQMELISYYGYGFPGHDSLKYYMATQELIWLFSPDEWIKWTVSNNEYSDTIDVSYEKEEIMRLVNNHYTRPSFFGQNFTSASNTLYVKDWTSSLDKYDIIVPDEITYDRGSDYINFKTSKLGTYHVRFAKRRVVNDVTLVYDNDSLRTQKLASFGEPYFEEFDMYISFTDSYVEILKKDVDTNEIITDTGNSIKVLNTTTNKYIRDSEYNFSNGITWLYLPVGKYKIEEVSASNGYYINTNGLEFEIVEGDDASKTIEFFNDKVEGKININKVDEDGNNLSGVKFEVYDEEDNLVDTIVTTDTKTESKNLPLGKYTVKEVETPYGYEKNDTIYEVNLEYNNQEESIVYNNLDVINKKIKCEIVLVTSSGEEVLNTNFNVYDLEGNIVYSGSTIDGKSEFYLPYGDYVLKEISVPDGYKLSEEEIKFSVNDITCASNFKINNEKIIMPDTTTQSSLLYFVILLINLGSYAYYKKNC